MLNLCVLDWCHGYNTLPNNCKSDLIRHTEKLSSDSMKCCKGKKLKKNGFFSHVKF